MKSQNAVFLVYNKYFIPGSPFGWQSCPWCIHQHQGLQWVILKQKRSRMKGMFPFSAVDKTVLTPQGRQETKGMASPIKFTEALQNGDALKINPQGGSLMEALGFDLEKVEEKDPDFYMPDGQGKKLSESYQMFTNEQTLEGNPGVIVELSNLVKKYGTSIYLMDRKSGHLYVLDEKGYKQIEEKGLLYPSESMIIAGALDENRSNPFIMT